MKSKISTISKQRQKKILSLVFQYWQRLLLASLCMMIVAGSTATMAYLIKYVMDDIFIGRNKEMLLILPGLAVLVFFLKGVGSYGSEYLMNFVGEKIIRSFRDSLYEKITDLPISFLHKEKTGALMSRITNDVNIVKGMVSSAAINLVRDVFTVIGLTVVIFVQDWKLACGAFLVLPIAFYPVVLFGRRVRKFSTGTQETMADLNSFLYETFTGSKIVKIFTMEDFEKRRFKEKTQELFRLEMKKVIAKALSSPIMEFLGGIAIAFIIWFGGIRVINEVSTTGTFFSFLTAVMLLYDPVKKLTKLNNTIQEGLASATRIFDILETEPDIKEIGNPKILNGKTFGVEFKEVSFSYRNEDEPALKHIDLKVEPGEVLALVGMSGGGKTSLVNLVPRLYDTTKGRVLMGNHDVKELSIKSLRDHISIVTQEPILFNESVKDNIKYGKMTATDQEIEAAAKAAYADDFVKGFSKGFDTVIGELGGRLSGGEKQRICIARALLKDAPVLILDEATSALDVQSESIVQKALQNLMKGRTTFVIAHRLSTVDDYASRIILLKNGEIAEQGTHEQMMNLKGEYYKFQTMQEAKTSQE
jgi:ATP-binding cassette, subfamily B, bacterial MsbA